MRWQVQEAKQRFSEVLRAARTGEPQIVTKHDEEIAVVMDIVDYRRLRGESITLMAYLHGEPQVDVDLDAEVERRRDQPRDVDLTS